MDGYYYTVVCILTALLGLCVGSFLNVVIYRLPNNMSLAKPSSHCPKCNKEIKWYDNIPVISYIILRGKCRNCGDKISPRYIFVELANMLLWLVSFFLFFDLSSVYSIIYFAIACIACSVCIIIFFIDLEHMIIFDRFQIILLVLAVVATFTDGDNYLTHGIGFVAGFAVFFVVSFFVGKATKKDSLGGGDIKFAAVAGLFLGWKRFILMMLVASISASIVLMIQRNKNGDEKGKEYPFAPFLTVAFVLTMFFGMPIISWYSGILLG